nr:immunoglobulin heavy chain junction region [Macaca mulatta]
CAAVLIPRYYW